MAPTPNVCQRHVHIVEVAVQQRDCEVQTVAAIVDQRERSALRRVVAAEPGAVRVAVARRGRVGIGIGLVQLGEGG